MSARQWAGALLVLSAGLLPAAGALAAAGNPADTAVGVSTLETLARKGSAVIPTPQETYWKGGGAITVGEGGESSLAVDAPAELQPLLEAEFAKRLQRRFGLARGTAGKAAARLVFTLTPSDEKVQAKLKTIGPEGYVIETGAGTILVAGNSGAALWHGMATVAQLIAASGGQFNFPQVEIVDYPAMAERALLVDLGGQGFMVGPSRWEEAQWKDFVDWMVDQKLNVLWLEFIGSGRLMGNLNMDAGEWAGFPVALASHPELVARDRPIRRWDDAQQKIVPDTFTAPNVKREFVHDLIDYAQARGVACHLLIGYDYFANQLPVVLKLPANDPANSEANKVYDTILREIVERYRNAAGVSLCTIEAKNPPPNIIAQIIRRTNMACEIIKSINPAMKISLLADYLEWQPSQLEDLALLKKSVPAEVSLAYSPHGEPQQKSWKRVYGDVWRYKNYTQYAWDHIVHVFPERIQAETLGAYADGYRKVVTQAWYFDVSSLNFLALAEYSWNLTSSPVDEFWPQALERTFGPRAAGPMRTALAHTRFDVRFDIISRIILRENILSPFSFWDMYVLTKIDRLTAPMLVDLETDARASLEAAREALPMASAPSRELVEMTIVSAERRLYLATSAQHLLNALDLKDKGDIPAARLEMDGCLAEGAKLLQAANKLGIEYPMAVHDDEVVQRYQQVRDGL